MPEGSLGQKRRFEPLSATSGLPRISDIRQIGPIGPFRANNRNGASPPSIFRPDGSQRVQSNDVTTDDRGLFYLLDRLFGLTILERC